MSKPLVSIVIPCYNARPFIDQTLSSILEQSLSELEVIIIDDGSMDGSKERILAFNDERIIYKYQTNRGVSAARNEGLKLVKGDYVVFFDADDQMTEDFLQVRYNALKDSNELDFVSGEVIRIKNDKELEGYSRGVENISEILLYDPQVSSCPSNYMFKKEFLTANKLVFKDELSSTADRFFLIQCFAVGKSKSLHGKGALKYRVSDTSMSGALNLNLVNDNERYYKLLFNNHMIPAEIKNKSLFLGNYILFASYWKIREKAKAIKYAIRAFSIEPVSFIKKIV